MRYTHRGFVLCLICIVLFAVVSQRTPASNWPPAKALELSKKVRYLHNPEKLRRIEAILNETTQ